MSQTSGHGDFQYRLTQWLNYYRVEKLYSKSSCDLSPSPSPTTQTLDSVGTLSDDSSIEIRGFLVRGTVVERWSYKSQQVLWIVFSGSQVSCSETLDYFLKDKLRTHLILLLSRKMEQRGWLTLVSGYVLRASSVNFWDFSFVVVRLLTTSGLNFMGFVSTHMVQKVTTGDRIWDWSDFWSSSVVTFVFLEIPFGVSNLNSSPVPQWTVPYDVHRF